MLAGKAQIVALLGEALSHGRLRPQVVTITCRVRMIPAVWMLASQGAPRRRERPLVEAAVIGGQERWPRRIGGLANELRLQIAELSKEDVARAPTTRRTLIDLVAFAGYALALIGELAQFPNATTWGEWLKRPREPAAQGLANSPQASGN